MTASSSHQKFQIDKPRDTSKGKRSRKSTHRVATKKELIKENKGAIASTNCPLSIHLSQSIETIQGKQVIKESALNLDNIGTDALKEIINCLGWKKLCDKLEGLLQLVKEFYANIEESVYEKVFVSQKQVDISSLAINNLIGAPEHEEDDYSILMEGLDTNELVKKSCQSKKEEIWEIGKNNQNLKFNVGILQPK